MMIALAYRAGVRWPRRVSWAVGIAAVAALATSARGVSWSGGLASLVEWGVPAAALVAACTLSRDTVRRGRARALLRISRRRVLFALSRAPAGGRRRAPHHRALGRLLGLSLGLCAADFLRLDQRPRWSSYLAFEKPITRALQRRIRKPAAATLARDQLYRPSRAQVAASAPTSSSRPSRPANTGSTPMPRTTLASRIFRPIQSSPR